MTTTGREWWRKNRWGSAGWILLAVALLCGARSASAYDLSFHVTPRQVELGQSVNVIFRFHGVSNPPQPILSGIDDFHVLGAPSKEFRTQSTPGGTTRSVTWTYRLSPKRVGKLALGPINYTGGGQTKVLPQVIVNVVEPSQKKEVFAEFTCPVSKVYLHQTFDVVLTIYSRNVNLGGDFRLSNMPDSRLNFQPFHQESAEPEVRNNQLYQVRRFKSEARALASGRFSIAPSLGVAIQMENKRRPRRAFDFFIGGPQLQYTQVTPSPIDITVQSLPQEGRPESFSGAVGSFDFEVTSQPNKVSAGDPINVTMKIRGHGNIDTVSAPSVDLGEDFKVYDARLVDKQLNDRRDRGRKVFEQVIIPRSDSIIEIPSFEFSYFDPEQESYKTLRRGPFPIQVAASIAASEVMQLQRDQQAARLQVLEEDIVYLKPAPGTWHKVERKVWFKRPGALALQLVPIMGCLGAWIGARRRDALSHDVALARRLQAPKVARAAMARARTALDEGNQDGFHEAVWEALSSYFGNRLNLTAGMISRQLVLSKLENSALAEADKQALENLFEQCEMARFGSMGGGGRGHSREDLEATFANLDRLLKTCDKLKGAF